MAAGLEQQAIAGVNSTARSAVSKEVIEQNWAVDEKPELFCFGLLESFDIRQLDGAGGAAAGELRRTEPRVQTELAGLADWYRLWQSSHDPLAAPSKD